MADVDIPSVLLRLGIQAKRTGREWTALCPNPEHDDKRPGWRIRDQAGSEKHGMHHCWSCGFGGSVDDLVMKVLKLSWAEAHDWLGGNAVAVERPVAATVELKQGPWDRSFHLPEGVEFGPLASWPKTIRTYAERRGIRPWQVERWGIGFAVAGRLMGRIVFVKRNAAGEPIGFTARTLIGDERRYLEPEPWEGADPAAIYGEQFWNDRGQRDRVFLVEGAINAHAVERALLEHTCDDEWFYPSVGATSGSQLHPLVASKLASFKIIVAVTDPDKAGDKFATMISDAVARHETEFRRVRLPEKTDAQSVSGAFLKEALT